MQTNLPKQCGANKITSTQIPSDTGGGAPSQTHLTEKLMPRSKSECQGGNQFSLYVQ